MAATASDGDGPITSINVTPFVDIILVVLIIFMATAPIIARRAVQIDIPKAAQHERAATEARQIAYTIKKEIIVDKRTLTPQQLVVLLQAGLKADPDLRVILSADKGLSYGDIVFLLDQVRLAGVKKIGLEVARK